MRIGIDIDNCISNFDDVLLEEYLKHDKELRNTGIINGKPYHITVGMFDWSKEENDDFYYNNIQRIAMSLKPLNNAKDVIDKLWIYVKFLDTFFYEFIYFFKLRLSS